MKVYRQGPPPRGYPRSRRWRQPPPAPGRAPDPAGGLRRSPGRHRRRVPACRGPGRRPGGPGRGRSDSQSTSTVPCRRRHPSARTCGRRPRPAPPP